jgi:heat shock protein HslJ/uncharacterized membrane protein
MIMKKIIYLLFPIISLIGCKSTTETIPKVEEPKTTKENLKNYFTANGNEPFWNIAISENQIEFTSLITGFENIKTPYVEPVRAMDANVKMYTIETESVQIKVQIFQSECTNSMSGIVSKYTVKIDLKHNKDLEYKTIEGCGNYITDYRLTDIWLLEELNNKKVIATDFNKELPLIEINTTDNKFFGYAGCNSMNGTLFFEKGIIRFTNIITTKMMCQKGNKESEFIKTLQSVTTYKIENNRLWLSNPNGMLAVFKKID